jgi:DNA polymerase-3 subunit delta
MAIGFSMPYDMDCSRLVCPEVFLFVIIYGRDDFVVRQTLNRMKQQCRVNGLGEADITVFDGKTANFEEVSTACNTISFLSPTRMVIVEGLLSRFEGKKKRGQGKAKSPDLSKWQSLAEMVLPESTLLVLTDGDIKKTNPLLKKLSGSADVRECSLMDVRGKELPEWIETRVKENGAMIERRAVGLLINLIGNNLWVLSSEIDKLCLFAQGRTINEADVSMLVSSARELNIFHLADAIIGRRASTSVQMLHQHLAEGDPPAYLLFMITAEFRLLIQAKRLSEDKIPVKEIGAKIGEYKDWKIEKMLREASGYSTARLERTYQRLLETDLSIKSGQVEAETALDLLVTDLCRR